MATSCHIASLSPASLRQLSPGPESATKVSAWIAASAFPKRNHSCRLSSRKLTNAIGFPTGRKLGSAISAVVEAPTKPQIRTDVQVAELYSCGDRLSEILCNGNIYLIGMMGCGKTTVGKILSESLGYYFFDSDTLVEQTAGTSVAEIFANRGEQAFRVLETQAIQNLSAMNGLIVATGGGAIIRPENWNLMKNGIVVWLDAPLTDLASRVVKAGVGSRPLVDSGKDEVDPYDAALDKLSTIYEKRKHLYPQADLRLSFTDIADRYEVGSVSALTPNMIALELIKGVTSVLEARHLSNAYCPLDPSWTGEDILLATPLTRESNSAGISVAA